MRTLFYFIFPTQFFGGGYALLPYKNIGLYITQHTKNVHTLKSTRRGFQRLTPMATQYLNTFILSSTPFVIAKQGVVAWNTLRI